MHSFNDVERPLVEQLVRAAINSDYSVSVAGTQIARSREEKDIFSAMFKHDVDRLMFRDLVGKHIGDVWLMYGMCEDVIGHWTTNHLTEKLITTVLVAAGYAPPRLAKYRP